MKIFGINIKKSYILHYIEPEDKIWFYDEPVSTKKEMDGRISFLNEKKAKIKITKRLTIEF